MRRLLTLAILVCLIAGAFVVDAAASGKKERTSRTETKLYLAPTLAQSRVCYPDIDLGCKGFDVLAGDQYVSVTVEDRLGFDVSGTVNEDVDGGRFAEIAHPFCGSTEKPIKLDPETIWVSITIEQGPCENGDLALASFGAITATFTNYRP